VPSSAVVGRGKRRLGLWLALAAGLGILALVALLVGLLLLYRS
jgi:hypothetical protein